MALTSDQTEGHGRIEVTTRNVADRVRHRPHGETKGERHAEETNPEAAVPTPKCGGQNRAPASSENQPKRAQKLRDQFTCHIEPPLVERKRLVIESKALLSSSYTTSNSAGLHLSFRPTFEHDSCTQFNPTNTRQRVYVSHPSHVTPASNRAELTHPPQRGRFDPSLSPRAVSFPVRLRTSRGAWLLLAHETWQTNPSTSQRTANLGPSGLLLWV